MRVLTLPVGRGTALALAFASPALAQEAAHDRAQSFEAVEGALQEDIPGGPLVVGSYGLIWVLLLLYVIRLVRQQQRTQSELERVEKLLSKGSGERG